MFFILLIDMLNFVYPILFIMWSIILYFIDNICGSGKFTIWPKLYLGPWPVPRRSLAEDEWSMAKARGNGWEATLSSALQNFDGKINVLVKTIPKQPPEGNVSGMGPTGKQSVKLDQGKCVPPSVNAPANTQSWLMGKDVWTV